MIEKSYKLGAPDGHKVEKILFDENMNYIHLVLEAGQDMPEHYSNANVYLTILKGTIAIKLEEQEYHEYEAYHMLTVPFNTKMHFKNAGEAILEILIFKAPAPAK